VVRVAGRASVQFAAGRGFLFRVIRVHDWSTYHGWVWLDGYELDSSGDAVERRSIFVQLDGLRQLHSNAARHHHSTARRPMRNNSSVLAQRVVRVH
jgi:hypothetical protein